MLPFSCFNPDDRTKSSHQTHSSSLLFLLSAWSLGPHYHFLIGKMRNVIPPLWAGSAHVWLGIGQVHGRRSRSPSTGGTWHLQERQTCADNCTTIWQWLGQARAECCRSLDRGVSWQRKGRERTKTGMLDTEFPSPIEQVVGEKKKERHA